MLPTDRWIALNNQLQVYILNHIAVKSYTFLVYFSANLLISCVNILVWTIFRKNQILLFPNHSIPNVTFEKVLTFFYLFLIYLSISHLNRNVHFFLQCSTKLHFVFFCSSQNAFCTIPSCFLAFLNNIFSTPIKSALNYSTGYFLDF